ncbi:MAG: smc 7 [Chthonomonadaceae bacterium]|nr:smc 7 [Chthonomonadaceae bacterium]
MVGAVATAAKTLETARRLQTRARLTAQAFAVVWRAGLALIVAFAADMVWPWPMLLRVLFLVVWIGGIGFGLLRSWRHERQSIPREEQVAREIEALHPDLDNALIHAVQFGSRVEPAGPQAELIRRELARAELEASHLPPRTGATRVPVQRQRLFAILVLSFLLLTALITPRIYRFELPRFFAPWLDTPPFTLTDFSVLPAGAVVRSGESLVVSVRVGGWMPRRLELMTGSGKTMQPMALTATGEGTYVAQLDRLTQDTAYFVSADTGRSPRYLVHVNTAPQLHKLIVTTHPPAYAKQPDKTTELTQEAEISGLSGTKVDVNLETDRPITEAQLDITRQGMPPLHLHLAPESAAPTHAVGSFAIERDGDFHLHLTGTPAEGSLQTPDAAKGKITLVRDETPLVTIVTPGQNVIAKPDMTVPLKVEAEDDIALQRLEMHRIVNKGKEQAETIDLPTHPKQYVHAGRFDLKAIHAKPGDVIEYYATAYDNDPQGIHNTNSERYWIWVVSEEDYRKVLEQQRGPSQMMAQYRQLTDALKQLSDQQAELAKQMAALAEKAKHLSPDDKKGQEALKKQMDALRKQQQELQEQAKQLAKQMHDLAQQKPQYDIEKDLQKQMEQMAQAVEKAQEQMQSAQNASSPSAMSKAAQAAAQKLQKAAGSQAQATEKMLQALEKVAPLYDDLARLEELTNQQRQLAQQAQQLQQSNKPNDPFTQSRLKSLADQQAQNRDELNRIQQSLRDHAADAQSVAPEAAQTANQIADAIGEMNISQKMQGAQQALEQKDTKEGASQAQAARDALESLLAKLKQGEGQCNGSCNKIGLGLGMSSGMGKTLSQMGQRMAQGRGAGRNRGRGQGQGSGTGQGQGQASGGYQAPQPGSRPGDPSRSGSQNGDAQEAMAMSLTPQAPSGSRSKPNSKGGPRAQSLAAFSKDNSEKPEADSTKPAAKASDKEAARYPSEYRRLVRDYFKSVAGQK